jgi:O-antigen ligase
VTTLTVRTAPVTRQSALPDLLVIGGAAIAPIDLFIVRSLTVYDVCIALAAVYLVRQRRMVWPSWGYNAAAYVFVLTALLSAFRATHPFEALTQVLQYAFIFFVQVPAVLSVVTSRYRAVVSVALLCVGTLVAVAYAWWFQPTQGSGRVVAFFSENPNRLGYPAAYLLPLLLTLWVLSRRARARRLRVTATVGVVVGVFLSIWAVYASGSRSSVPGAVVALLVLVVLRPGLGLVRAAGRLVVLLLVCGVLVGGLAAAGQLPDTLEDRITRSFDVGDPEARSNLVGDREHLLDAGIAAFRESPLLGTGLDNFRYVAPAYDVEATTQLPHNLWLQLLAQVGVIGTAAFATWLVLWGRDVVTAVRRVAWADAHLLWGIFSALAGILAIFFFAPEMLDRHYWLIAALGLAAVRGSRGHATTKGPPS